MSTHSFLHPLVLLFGLALAFPAISDSVDEGWGSPKARTREQITDVPGLPRALIIGDSISLGYTLGVRERLRGRINVHRPPPNCGGTKRSLKVSNGIRNIDAWLGEDIWDLIHFNWGLWDINRFIDGQRNEDGPISVSEETYAENLEILVKRLKETGAVLVWAPTTFVQGGWGRRPGDEIRYNAIAKEIMARHGVLINDLHALTATFPVYGQAPDGEPELFAGAGDVHFSDAGSERLAEQVANAIATALADKNTSYTKGLNSMAFDGSGTAWAKEGSLLPAWQEGWLEIHHINTGRGDSTFLILPDGTTLLVDACDASGMPRPDGFTAPARPDADLPAGTVIGRYIRARHPDGEAGALDYALMTHFHPDHISGLADVHDVVPIRTLMDRSWPETRKMPGRFRKMMTQYEAFRADYAAAGGHVERFFAGRLNQLALRRAPERYREYEVRNLAVSGQAWTGTGEETRPLREEGEPGQENNNSAAFVMRYGTFAYFNGGDILGTMEKLITPVLSPVDIHVANHHGSEAGADFLAALRPRVHIVQVWDSIQPRWHALERMRDEKIYPGPRDIFLTNGLWPERRHHILEGPHKFPEEVAQSYLDALEELAAIQGHIVVRVPPGGTQYQVLMIEDADESFRVKSIHGPYTSR